MNMTRDRVQSLAWALIVSVSFALLLALTFRVNAVKSEVRLMDRKILSIKQQKMLLETEFQTRSNQIQLAEYNAVGLGLQAPRAGQYLDGEPQLAVLSKPVAPDAPAPIMMASAEVPAGIKHVPAGGVTAAVFTAAASKSPLGDASATRMLAQHGEKVAPGGKDRLERTLALANAQTRAVPLGRQKHTLPVPAAGPPAASADFLAAATGNDRLRTMAPGSAKKSAPALAASKPARKPATVADAFGGDWMGQIATKPKAAHRRADNQDVAQAAGE